MVQRYFLHISYNGFGYRGWQKQSGALSIQETLEDALSRILKMAISVVGCGRTDAQVHATQFFAQMDIEKEWDFDLVYRLNQLLPSQIVVYDIILMSGFPNARFDVVERTYDYFIHTEKDPFLEGLSYFFPHKYLRLDKMILATHILLKHQDFQSFCKTPEHNQTTICKVTSAQLFSNANGNRIQFQITANRFLRGMIRVIVQNLLEIGMGEKSVDEFENHLSEKESSEIKAIAAPAGLYLSKVTYPFLNIPAPIKAPPTFLH